MIDGLIMAIVLIVIVGPPMVGTFWWAGRMARRHYEYVERLGERGTTYTGDLAMRFALIIFWLGAMFAGLSLLPLLVWLATDDMEGRRTFFAMLVVAVVILGLSLLISWPAWKVWILEPDGVTLKRLRSERHIRYSDITELRERPSLTGTLEVRSSEQRIRIPTHITGYDGIFDRLRGAAPEARYLGRGADGDTPLGDPATSVARFGVSKLRLRVTIGCLAAFFLFFMIWPWFLVEGDHPVRDSFAFMGIGALIWAAFAFLIGVETFQRHQPIELELRPGEIAFRVLRGDWIVKRDLELVSATVETRIIFVKGQKGYRHPLVFVFTGGERVELDQHRARNMRTSTHRLAAEIQRRYFEAGRFTEAYREASDQWLARAQALVEHGRDDEAIDSYQHAIATYPDAERRALLRTVGDLQRRQVDLPAAISSYEAHLDFAPGDTRAWQGLAAAYIDIGWRDSAAEATEKAQQLLINAAA